MPERKSQKDIVMIDVENKNRHADDDLSEEKWGKSVVESWVSMSW